MPQQAATSKHISSRLAVLRLVHRSAPWAQAPMQGEAACVVHARKSDLQLGRTHEDVALTAAKS